VLMAGMVAFFTTPALAQERAAERTTVDASTPIALAVTVYRDPDRGDGGEMNRSWPQGFAMISETRQVTLPPGESSIRFEGVAEGMVAVSAIVTGLPGGTIEKNRNADLLSPAALVDGTLGNRVRVTRTNPATGEEAEESAVIRTRADGGLVLQTAQGFEAVRCAGVPERLAFDRTPAGLSALPVYSIDTRDPRGGTYTVTLTYLSWGFDWQANYVATLAEGGTGDDVSLRLMSWLTILNDNNQTFPNAELMAVAGTLEVVSDFQSLADPPAARPLQLTCYPLGSTAAGSPLPDYSTRDYRAEDSIGYLAGASAPPPPPAPVAMMRAQEIVVTGARIAQQEQLGDLKLYRFPEAVTVGAKGLKQVAFLDRGEVEGRLLYRQWCQPGGQAEAPEPLDMLLATVNDRAHGLGVALPSGAMAVFERGPTGELLVASPSLRDYAEGQDVELALGQSTQVFLQCSRLTTHDPSEARWTRMRAVLTNANNAPVTVRLQQGASGDVTVRGRASRVKDGMRIVEVSVPANGERVVEWDVRPALAR
jgi:hypothetical protein